MNYSFTIPGRLPSLNEYTRACRANKYVGAKMKKDAEDIIKWSVHLAPIKGKVKLHFYWVEENRKRDLDNIAFAKKFILDALVQKGILEGDGWNTVVGFTDHFYVLKDDPKVQVVIEETD